MSIIVQSKQVSIKEEAFLFQKKKELLKLNKSFSLEKRIEEEFNAAVQSCLPIQERTNVIFLQLNEMAVKKTIFNEVTNILDEISSRPSRHRGFFKDVKANLDEFFESNLNNEHSVESRVATFIKLKYDYEWIKEQIREDFKLLKGIEQELDSCYKRRLIKWEFIEEAFKICNMRLNLSLSCAEFRQQFSSL